MSIPDNMIAPPISAVLPSNSDELNMNPVDRAECVVIMAHPLMPEVL